MRMGNLCISCYQVGVKKDTCRQNRVFMSKFSTTLNCHIRIEQVMQCSHMQIVDPFINYIIYKYKIITRKYS